MAGKGDTPRAVDGEKFRKNFDLIFPSKKSCRFTKVHDIRPQMTKPSTPAAVTDDGHEQ
jgi:hypothetical protein